MTELLFNFKEQRRLDDPEGKAEHALTPNEILALNTLLQDWAEFTPKGDRPVALVELRLRDKRNRQLALPEQLPENADGPKEGGDDDDDSEAEQDIGILNSFYLEDLERAIATVQEGNIPDALKQYLTPLSLRNVSISIQMPDIAPFSICFIRAISIMVVGLRSHIVP
ncbi:hypothetical protein [Agrobacterium sp. DSM 25558]|uniref:hypothetical protein n=1 Tax=Agrobacterium sp. DSM 25558 TaxID=1907665 RepID=UPI00352EC7E0